ncbi:MAG: hypothetical protein ACRC0R_04225 [Cetobacterium sp.]
MKKGEEVQDVSLNNTATGIKSLGILLQLLSNASIKNKVTGLNAYLAEEENGVTTFKDKTNEFGEI